MLGVTRNDASIPGGDKDLCRVLVRFQLIEDRSSSLTQASS
jgi:hypothetical protein